MSNLVSVVMPTFGHAHLIKESVDSIMAQSYQDIELVIVPVVDDTDTINVISALDDPRIRIIPSNYANITHQMNIGLYSDAGQYMMLFASDDIMYENCVRSLVRFSRRRDSLLVYYYFHVTGRRRRRNKLQELPKFEPGLIHKKCFIPDTSFVHRETFLSYMPMRFASGRNRIWDLWKRFLDEHPHRIHRLARPLFAYRQQPKSEHRVQKQKVYRVGRFGELVELEAINRDIPIAESSDLDCCVFCGPAIFLVSPDLYKHKRIIIVWDVYEERFVKELQSYKQVHHVTTNPRLALELQRQELANVRLFECSTDLVSYAFEENYDSIIKNGGQ